MISDLRCEMFAVLAMRDEKPSQPEVERTALAFATALATGDWEAAHARLSPALRDDWQPSDLKGEYSQMTNYWDKPATSVQLGYAISERAYAAIYSTSVSYGTVQEGVDVRVIHERGRWLIDHIVWGRP